jgi:hypothetical protein
VTHATKGQPRIVLDAVLLLTSHHHLEPILHLRTVITVSTQHALQVQGRAPFRSVLEAPRVVIAHLSRPRADAGVCSPVEKRKAEAERIRQKYPDRIPVGILRVEC